MRECMWEVLARQCTTTTTTTHISVACLISNGCGGCIICIYTIHTYVVGKSVSFIRVRLLLKIEFVETKTCGNNLCVYGLSQEF